MSFRCCDPMPTNTIADNTAPKSIQNTKRMSIGLSGETVELLEFLADSQGISQNEAIRRAIATDVYFLKERLEGSKVLIQKSDKEIREVLFR
jgi:Ribbon-helix-helix protein, copG family